MVESDDANFVARSKQRCRDGENAQRRGRLKAGKRRKEEDDFLGSQPHNPLTARDKNRWHRQPRLLAFSPGSLTQQLAKLTQQLSKVKGEPFATL